MNPTDTYVKSLEEEGGILKTNEIAHESDTCNPDEEQISVSINTSTVESELKGQIRNEYEKALQQSLHQINNGYALVIHNRFFDKLPSRRGSEKDFDAIKIFCKEAGLYLDIIENVKVNEIRRHCSQLTGDESEFQKYDGFVCFILSHGNSSGICGVSDKTISVEEIVSYFKENNDLLGKPKLFFIQACRAGVEDDNTRIDHEKTLCPPGSSDILVAYSTIDGELSYRDIDNGSWFIQTLLKQISTHAYNEHLMDIMILVNKKIATSGLEDKKQMPQQVSTLTKFVYFKMAEVGKVLEAKNSILSREGTSARMRSNSLAVYNNEHGELDCVAAIRTRPRSLSDYRSDHTDTWTRPRSQSDNNDDSESGRGDIQSTFASVLNRNHNDDSEHIVVQPHDVMRALADLISSFNGGRK